MTMDEPYYRKELRGLTGKTRLRVQRFTGKIILQVEEEFRNWKLFLGRETLLTTEFEWWDARLSDMNLSQLVTWRENMA